MKDIAMVPTPMPGLGSAKGQVAGVHFFIEDKSGKSFVVDPVDGTLKLSDEPLGVMTNAPTYDWHMTNLANYPPGSGAERHRRGRGAGLNILNQFDIPKGSVVNAAIGAPTDEITEWTSVNDLKNLRWYFRTHRDRSIRMVDLKEAVAAAKGEIRVFPWKLRPSRSPMCVEGDVEPRAALEAD